MKKASRSFLKNSLFQGITNRLDHLFDQIKRAPSGIIQVNGCLLNLGIFGINDRLCFQSMEILRVDLKAKFISTFIVQA